MNATANIPSPIPEKPTEEQFKAYHKSLIPLPVVHKRGQCGHKIAGKNDPRTNCIDCWMTYFLANPGIVAGARSVLSVYGKKRLESLRGEKFVKMMERTIGLEKKEGTP